jgi:hypothetical protein
VDGLVTREFGEELAPDEISGQDEEEVYAGPAPTTAIVQTRRVAEHIIVVQEYDNNSQGPEMVQAGEAVAGYCLHKKGSLNFAAVRITENPSI